MKPTVLLAGNWAWDIYEKALARGFIGQGWDVLPFRTGEIPGRPNEDSIIARVRPTWALKAVNNSLLKTALHARPKMIFLWRCIDILPKTINQLKKHLPDTTIVAYHNDNPFSGLKARMKCRHFLAGLQHVDIAAVYRPDNIEHALNLRAPRVELLMPSFVRTLHKHNDGNKQTEVIFIGHYESDGRTEALTGLHKSGIDVQVRGQRWQSAQRKHPWLAKQPIKQLWGAPYVDALANAKIALAFLSTKNNDVYTRRCFEIPACGSLLMAPRTPELQQLFREDEEAVFWTTTDELVSKVHFLLKNESQRATIAAAGQQRVLHDQHDEYGRAKQVIAWLSPQ